MLRAQVKIGSDNAVWTDTAYGLVYLDSDKRVGPESKGFESTAYAEEDGEHIIPKTVDAAYDYKVKFFIQPGTSLENANKKIATFNSALYDYQLDDNNQPTPVKVFKKVEFYNYYKRHKIVGYPKEIPEATEFWRDRKNQLNDVVVVEWTIRVTKPSECDYNITDITL